MTNSNDGVQQYKIPAVATVAVLLPWIWTIGLVPTWIAALSALFSMVAVILLVYASRPALRKEEGTEASLAESLHTFLHRWSGMAHQTQDNLQDVRVQIHGVMEQTEQAVLNLSGSFRNITAKTNEQMTYALNLLQNTHGMVAGSEYMNGAAQSPSLPDYIRASEEMMQRLAEAMGRYNEVSSKLLAYENQMQAADQGADELFARLNNALRKIGVNVSVMQTTEGAAAADAAHDALRYEQELHDYLRLLRSGRSDVCKNICNIASEVKDAGEAVRREMALLATSMRKKNEEVASLVSRINALGEEVRKDIYKVIVELQFQDITHQKLERVRTPLLNELGQGLRAIAQETHVIYEKLRRSVADHGRVPEPMPAEEQKPVHHLQAGHQKPELGNKVELF